MEILFFDKSLKDKRK